MNDTIAFSGATIPAPAIGVRGIKLEKAARFVILAVFAIASLFSVYGLISGRNADFGNRRTLALIQCVIGLATVHVPAILKSLLKMEMPSAIEVMWYAFLFCGIFLGENLSFYFTVPCWDVLMHGGSGVLIGFLGFMLVDAMNKNRRINLSPAFIAMFAFCFAVCVGAVWEIYEFSVDGLLGLNMQKAILEDGTQLAGHLALGDTMKDIVVDCIGALTAAATGAFSLKREKGWIYEYLYGEAKPGKVVQAAHRFTPSNIAAGKAAS